MSTDLPPRRPALRKKIFSGCLIALLGGVLTIVGIVIFFAVLGLFLGGQSYEDKIAQIDIEGVISSVSASSWAGAGESMTTRLTRSIRAAAEDESVKGVVLRINSPGGEVTASDTLYHEVTKLAEKKPVIVYMDTVAASGGYYIACGAKEIMANETTMTGSIGVIISTLNYEQLFGKIGLQSVAFTSGKFKDLLSGSRPMRDDEKALVQEMVNEIYERFLTVVKEARPDIPETQLREQIADGRIFSGRLAKEKGLIDATGYLEDAAARVREIAKLDEEIELVPYNQSESFFEIVMGVRSRLSQANKQNTETGKIEIQLPDAFLPTLRPGMMYLLPQFYAR